MYKSILKRLDKIPNIGVVLSYYSGTLFQFMEKETYYELIFNRQFNSPIYIPKLTEDQIKLAPYFYLDDDEIMLNIERVLILVVIDRLEFLRKDDYKVRHHKYLKKDIAAVTRSIDSVQPTSYNNKIKLENRVRILKTYEIKKEQVDYFESVGKGLWISKVPNTENDIRKYSKLFNDPIAVASITEGVYCDLRGAQYNSAGYHSTDKEIVSIYDAKSSLPERLRIQYTSSFLTPVNPQRDYLITEEKNKEKTNAVTVFMPALNKSDDDRSPLGKWTLLTGEVLVSKKLAQREFYVRRTFQTDTLNVNVVQEGDILQPGDIIAYDAEEKPTLKYDLNYEDALVEEVVKLWNGYKIILKVKSPLGIARVVSETGLKGVTHPRQDLGTVTLPELFGGEVLTVDMVVGPNSMKAGTNGIKLAWLNLIAERGDEAFNIDPSEIDSEEVEYLANDIRKVKWEYQGKIYDTYVGLISFGVTDLAKDCRSQGVRIMPETLKYMYLSKNKNLHKISDILLDKYVDLDNKWILSHLLKLKHGCPSEDDKVPVFEWNDPKFQDLLKNTFFNTSHWTTNIKGMPAANNVLLNPFNDGFYIKFHDKHFRMPSAALINALTYTGQGNINYPMFLSFAVFLLMSLRSYFMTNSTSEQVLSNYTKYIYYVDDEIFAKKSALSKCLGPVVEGGNLKQLVSTWVPRGVTVILDGKLEKQVKDFSSYYHKQVYEIGVRNPVIWRFQFLPRKVWTFSKFKKYLSNKNININDVLLPEMVDGAVLRNIVDVMFDRSDTDGDLYPVAIPLDMDIQDLLNKYSKHPTKLLDYEKEWIFDYIDDELSKNEKFINVENKPFAFHMISRKKFSEFLANAAIAKAKVGIGTVDLWKFHAAAEWLYVDGEISREDLDYQQFLFSSIVQNTVIEGIKHVSTGSSGYDIFALATIGEHEDIARTVLKDNLNVRKEMVDLFVYISMEANDNVYSKTVSRLPNGGMSSYLANLTPYLTNMSDLYKEGISYCRILKPYWKPLLKAVDNISSVDQEEEEYSSDMVVNY